MDIKEKVIGGLKWSLIAKVFSQSFSWISTFWVIRLLQPEDYGLAAIGSATVALGFLISELGLGAAIINAEELTRQKLRQVFTLTLFVCTSLYITIYFSSDYLAQLYGNEKLAELLKVMGLQLLISIFLVVPSSMLSREMRFKERSIMEMIAGFVTAATTLGFALSGYGVWSLVYGTLVGYSSRTLMFNIKSKREYLPTLDFSSFSSMGRYGFFNFLNRLIWFAYMKADVFIIGKVLSIQLAGVYSVANQLASIPLEKFGSIINQVGLAAYSKIKTDINAVSYYFKSTSELAAIVVFPVFLGISAISAELVAIVLGEKWEAAAVPMMLLALTLPIRVLVLLLNNVLDGIGKPEYGTKNLITCFVLVLIGIFAGIDYGINGVCLGIVGAYVIYFVVALLRILPLLNLSFFDYMLLIVRPAILSAIMYLALLYIPQVLELENYLLLIIKILAGGLIYCAGALLFFKQESKQRLFNMIKKRGS